MGRGSSGQIPAGVWWGWPSFCDYWEPIILKRRSLKGIKWNKHYYYLCRRHCSFLLTQNSNTLWTSSNKNNAGLQHHAILAVQIQTRWHAAKVLTTCQNMGIHSRCSSKNWHPDGTPSDSCVAGWFAQSYRNFIGFDPSSYESSRHPRWSVTLHGLQYAFNSIQLPFNIFSSKDREVRVWGKMINRKMDCSDLFSNPMTQYRFLYEAWYKTAYNTLW